MGYMDFVKKQISDSSDDLCAMSDSIWEFAEIRYQESKSSALQRKVLEENGFSIRTDIAGIPTAFAATYGAGKPVIAILGEFDALEDLSQEADCCEPRKKDSCSNGHGCGHNALGSAGVYAALAVKEYLRQYGKQGTIRYFGCPAEEGGSGKTFMVRSGAFDGVDIALTWHPNYYTSIIKTGSLANVRCVFRFHGISSHAAASPQLGRNALSAVELMNIGVNYYREHLIPEARIHYAVTNSGGDASNIIQKEAEVVYAIRAPKVPQIGDILKRVEKIAQGAALMTETTMESRIISGYSDYISNPVVERAVMEVLRENHVCGFSEEELAYAKRFADTNDCGYNVLPEGSVMHDGVLSPMPMLGSTDVGDVSWNVPTAQFYMACYAKGTCLHSWQATAQGKSPLMHKAAVEAATVLALSAVRFFESPTLVAEAKEAFDQQQAGERYTCPIPGETVPGLS